MINAVRLSLNLFIFFKQNNKKVYLPLAAWSSGFVSACHRGDGSYGS
jgi:hypothetical protein